MTIIAFGASTSKHSINRKLATYATTFFDGAEVNVLDLNDFEMPMYSVDKEAENGIPKQAYDFLAVIGSADLLILSMAEHNGSYTAAFKNLMDWTSRIEGKLFQGKPMFLLSTSTGGRGGMSVMEAAKNRFPFHDAKIMATYSLPFFNNHFSDDKGIIDSDLKTVFLQVVAKVKDSIAF